MCMYSAWTEKNTYDDPAARMRRTYLPVRSRQTSLYQKEKTGLRLGAFLSASRFLSLIIRFFDPHYAPRRTVTDGPCHTQGFYYFIT